MFLYLAGGEGPRVRSRATKALGVASMPPLGKRCPGEDSLALADAVHLGATDRALAPGGRIAVLHGDLLGTLHLSLRPALQTVCLHPMVPPSLLFPNGRRRAPQERMPVEPLAGGVRAVPQALRIPLVFESDSLGRIIALFRPMSRESTCEFADDFLQCRLQDDEASLAHVAAVLFSEQGGVPRFQDAVGRAQQLLPDAFFGSFPQF